jgi:hypothetical protein
MRACPSRRDVLLGGAALAALAGAWAAPAALPVAASLPAELAAAGAKGRPLVVMVSLDHCPFCKIVRENYLVPLRESGQPVVQIDMNHSEPLVDPAGKASTHGQVARALGVRVAPTVLFLGAGGKELAPRLVGLSEDFYAAYLQQRLEAAAKAAG